MGKDDGFLAVIAIGLAILGIAGALSKSKPKCPVCKFTLQGKPSMCPQCRTPLTWRK